MLYNPYKGQFLRKIVAVLILVFVSSAYGEPVKFRARFDLALTGTRTVFNQDGFSDWNNLTEFFLLAGVQQIIQWHSVLFEIRPEIRYLNSNAFQSDKSDLAYPSISTPGRKMHLSKNIQSANTSESLIDIETIYLKIQTDRFEGMAGRQNLNLGIIKNFPIWNKFANFNLINTRVQLQPGVDQATVRIQGERWWMQGISVFSDDEKLNAYLALAGFPLEFLEFQLLGAKWWQSSVAGFNIQKDLKGILFKTEWLSIGLDSGDVDKHVQGAVAAEYAFSEDWSTTIEYIYASVGSTVPKDITLLPPSKFFPLRSAHYLLWQLDWQVSPFWNISVIPLINLVDKSSLVSLSIRKNISDNIDLNFQYKVPTGPPETELSARAFEFRNGSYIGVNQTALVQLKMFF